MSVHYDIYGRRMSDYEFDYINREYNTQQLRASEKYIDVTRLYIEYEGFQTIPNIGTKSTFYVYYESCLIAKYFALLKDKDFLSVNSYYQKYKISTDIRYNMVDEVKMFINKNGGLVRFSNMSPEDIRQSKIQKKIVSAENPEKTKEKVREIKKMETVKKSLSTAKSEALEASKRESVNAAWEVLKNGVIKLGLDGLPDDRAKQAKELLDTKLGDMFLRIVISAALEQITSSNTVTKSTSDVKINALTKELRIQGYQSVLNSYLTPMTLIINEALKQMSPFAATLEEIE